MKTLKQIQEGFFDTSGTGKEAFIKKRVEELGITDYTLDNGVVRIHKKPKIDIKKFMGTSLEVNLESDMKITDIKIEDCPNLETIKGIPNNLRILSIEKCNKLKNLLDCPKEVRNLFIRDCQAFESLSGCPETLYSIDIIRCNKLRDLRGISQFSNLGIYISKCKGFESLSGCAKLVHSIHVDDSTLSTLVGSPEICMNYTIEDCSKITNLIGMPRRVDGDISIHRCKQLESVRGLSSLIGGDLELLLYNDIEWDVTIENIGCYKHTPTGWPKKKTTNRYVYIETTKKKGCKLTKQAVENSIKKKADNIEIEVKFG